MEIDVDFQSDLIRWCTKQLMAGGYHCKVDPKTPDLPVLQYFNVLHKHIPAKPRRVKRSPQFRCPTENRPGLARFLRKVRRGDRLMAHASSLIKRADFGDLMLNDWGIHHFHLGITVQNDGFVERTDNLLFALVTEGALHCIDILPHADGAGLPNFAEQRLVEIVHVNWPEFLAHAIPPGTQGFAMMKETLAGLRKAGLLTLTVMSDGTTYLPPGGGFVKSTHSMRARRRANRLLTAVHSAEQELRTKLDHVARMAATAGAPLPPKPTFELMFRNGWICAVEKSALLCVELMPVS
jgi:hypothetical protein